jgi:hypothetical protein
VAEALLVGYGFNNLIPARLGELVRADYAKRQFGVSRSAALGSIVIERLLDGFIVVLCLSEGLLVISLLRQRISEGFDTYSSFHKRRVGRQFRPTERRGVLWIRHKAVRGEKKRGPRIRLLNRPLSSLREPHDR